MKHLLLLCVLAGLLLSGCRKKTSPEFYKLEADQSILISRDGDDAYASPEMAAIINGLQAIPENMVERPRALELAAKLTAEQSRVASERAAAGKEKPPEAVKDPYAGRLQRDKVVEVAAPPPDDADDAGEPMPYFGMDEATFGSLFGRCFAQGPTMRIADGGAATSQVLGPNPECQKRHGTPGSVTSYLFVDGGVWGKHVETTTVVDAGPPPPPPPPPPPAAPPDAGEPILTIPGAPLPEGFQKSTVY
jgi:hypothetical protein